MATITASDRIALIRLAASLPSGSEEKRAILAGIRSAGCEKLPEGPMRDNCEKKKEEGGGDSEKKAAGDPKRVFYDVIYPALQKAGYSGPEAFQMARAAVDAAFRDAREMFAPR